MLGFFSQIVMRQMHAEIRDKVPQAFVIGVIRSVRST